MARVPRREHLVRTALELFARNGFHATGVDRIQQRAGVSKKTLYRHFRSKDELILAVLTYYDRRFREDFVRRVEESARTPRGRLLGVFDVAEDWFSSRGFYGCLFINAIGEHSARESAVRRVSREFKRLMRDHLYELAREAELRDPGRVADQLALLLEGAIVTAQVSRRPDAARTAKQAARVLIRAAQRDG